MPDLTPSHPSNFGPEVRTSFVRHRNAMVARATLTELFVDYHLHLGSQQMKPSAEAAAMFKRALAGFVLHGASRPRNELMAWTINFQSPLTNIFLVGDNETGAVTGQVFEEGVKELPQNLFYADVVRGGQPKRRSAVTFAGNDPLVAIENFYTQSEQRAARYFQLGEEEFALVTEHPDADLEWLRGLTPSAVRDLAEKETVVLLERRVSQWHCGCNHERMREVLAPTMRQDPGMLFGDGEKLEIRCPRCGARHAITREAMEAFVAETK